MTIDDVYVNLDNISSAKYDFKHIEGFDSVFKNMMRYLHKYLSLLIGPWTRHSVLYTWVECYISKYEYSYNALDEFIKNSVNQTYDYRSCYPLPSGEIGDWRIIIYTVGGFDSVVYFVNANIGRTIEVNFRRMSGPLLTDSLKKLKDII